MVIFKTITKRRMLQNSDCCKNMIMYLFDLLILTKRKAMNYTFLFKLKTFFLFLNVDFSNRSYS